MLASNGDVSEKLFVKTKCSGVDKKQNKNKNDKPNSFLFIISVVVGVRQRTKCIPGIPERS